MQVNPDNKVQELRPTDEKNAILPLPLPIPPALIETRAINAEPITLEAEKQIELLMKGNVSLNQFHSFESKYPFISQLFNGQTEFETLTPVQTQLLVYYLLKSNPAKSLSNLFEWLNPDTHVSKFDAFNIFFEENNVSIKFENVSIKMSVSQFFRFQKGKDIEEPVLIKTRDKTFTEKEDDRQYTNFAYNEYLTLVAGVKEVITSYSAIADRKKEATRNYNYLLTTCSFINWFGKISFRGCYALFDYKRDKNLNNLNVFLGSDFKDINSLRIYLSNSFTFILLEYLLWPLINNPECFPIVYKLCQELKLKSYSINVYGTPYSLNHFLSHSLVAKYNVNNYETFSSPYNLDLGRRISEYFPYFKITIYPIPVSNPACVIFEGRNVNQEILSGHFDLHDVRKSIIIKLNDNCQFDSNLPSLTYKFLKILAGITSPFPPINGCTYMSLSETLVCMKQRGIEAVVFAYILGLVGKDEDALKLLEKLSAVVDFSKVPNYIMDGKTLNIADEIARHLNNEEYVVLPEAAYEKLATYLMDISCFLKPGARFSRVRISRKGKNCTSEFIAGRIQIGVGIRFKFDDGLLIECGNKLSFIYELVNSIAGYSYQFRLKENHPFIELKKIFQILSNQKYCSRHGRLWLNSKEVISEGAFLDSIILFKIISNKSTQLLRKVAEVVDINAIRSITIDGKAVDVAKEASELLAADKFITLPEPAYEKLANYLKHISPLLKPGARFSPVCISRNGKSCTSEFIAGQIPLEAGIEIKFEDGLTLICGQRATHIFEFIKTSAGYQGSLKKNHPFIELKKIFQILSKQKYSNKYGYLTHPKEAVEEGAFLDSAILFKIISSIKPLQLLRKIAEVVDIKAIRSITIDGETVDVAKEATELLAADKFITLPEAAYGRLANYLKHISCFLKPGARFSPVCISSDGKNCTSEFIAGQITLVLDLQIEFADGLILKTRYYKKNRTNFENKNLIQLLELIKLSAGYSEQARWKVNHPFLALKEIFQKLSKIEYKRKCAYFVPSPEVKEGAFVDSIVLNTIINCIKNGEESKELLRKIAEVVDIKAIRSITIDGKTVDVARMAAELLDENVYVDLPEPAQSKLLERLTKNNFTRFIRPDARLGKVRISIDEKNVTQEVISGSIDLLDPSKNFTVQFEDGVTLYDFNLKFIEFIRLLANPNAKHPYVDLRRVFEILSERSDKDGSVTDLILFEIISNIKSGKDSIQLLRSITDVIDINAFGWVNVKGETVDVAKMAAELLATDKFVNLPEPAYSKLLERVTRSQLKHFIRPGAKLNAVCITLEGNDVTQEVIKGTLDLLDVSKNYRVLFEDGIKLYGSGFYFIDLIRLLVNPNLNKNHPYVNLKECFSILMKYHYGYSSILLSIISSIKSGKDSILLLDKIAEVIDIKAIDPIVEDEKTIDVAEEAEQLLLTYKNGYVYLPEHIYNKLIERIDVDYLIRPGARLGAVTILEGLKNVTQDIIADKIDLLDKRRRFTFKFEDGLTLAEPVETGFFVEFIRLLTGLSSRSSLKVNHPYIDLKELLKRLYEKNISSPTDFSLVLQRIIALIKNKTDSINLLRKIAEVIEIKDYIGMSVKVAEEASQLLGLSPIPAQEPARVFVPIPQLPVFKSILARIEKDIYGDPEVHASAVKYLFKQRGYFKLDGEMGKIPPIYQKCIQDYFFCNGQGDLTENMSIQVAETLFWAKFAEMRVKAAEIMTPQKGEASSRPCYIITQDTNRVHVKVLLAHFNEYGFLKAFGYDAEGVSREMLAGITGIGQAHETQTISIGQFRRLVQAIETMDVPPIMIERKKLNFYEPQEEGAVKPAEEVEEAAPIQEEGSKRKAEKLDKPEPKKKKVELPPDSVHQPAELPSAASKVKLRKPTDKKVKGKYKDLEWTKKSTMPKRTPKEIEEGILPNLPQAPLNIDQPELELDANNLWKFVGLNSARKLEKSLLDCDTIMSNLRQDIPLMDLHMHGPVLKLKQDKAAAVAPLNLLAKGYQTKEISQLLTAMNVGLNKLLSFEMGLGKTFVYVSLILEHIYRGTKGTHFITVPKSLIDSIYKDAVRILQEGVLTAWRYSFRKDPVKTMDEWFTRMFDSDPKGLDRLPLLMALSDVENEVIRHALAVRKKDYKYLVSDLIPQIESRIKKMAADVANRPDKLQELEDAFLGTSLALSDILEGSLKECLPNDPVEYLKVLSLVAFVNYARKPFPEEFSYDSKGIEALKRFKITSIGLVREFKEFRAAFNCPIILQTYDTVANPQMAEFKEALERKGTATAIFDEAQNMHNEKTNCFKGCQAFLSWVKPLQILPVTGTPLENNLKEVYTLLSIANPELFPQHICNALVNLFGEALKWIKAKNKDKAHSLILRSFAHHEVVKELAFAPLTDVVNKENPLVKSEWDNMVPEKIDISIPYSFTPPLQALYEKLFQDYKQGRAGLFDFNSNVNKLLTSSQIYSAASFTRDDPTCVQFLDKIRHGTAQEFQEVIESSPILTTLLKSGEMDAVVRGKEHALVFTANIVTAVALKRALEKAYGKDKVDVHFIKGKTKPEKRDRHITDFKRKDGKICRVFIVTSDTGSAGFNLGEADRVFMLDQDYNPMKQAQMEARVLRVGFSGTRRVVTPQINSGSQPIYSEVHKTSLQNLKKSLYGFLFNPKATYKENLKHWCDILLDTIYHQQLNADKNAAIADAERLSHLQLIEQLDAFTEEELKDYVELLTPEVEDTPPKRKATPEVEPQPKRVAPAPTELKRKTPPEAVDLAAKKTLAPSDVLNPAMYLPIPSGTKAESLKLGMLIAEGHANAQVFTSVRALAPLIRNPKQELLHHFEQHHKILRDLAAPLQGASRYRIEYYTLQAGRYVLNNVENPAYGKKIRLVIDRPDDYSLLVKFAN